MSTEALTLPLATKDVATGEPPKRGRRALTVLRENAVPDLARHTDDGWQIADQYPLSSVTRAALRGLIIAACPPPPAPWPADMSDRVELYMRRFMNYMNPMAALGMTVSFLLLDWLPILTFRSFSRLQKMDRTAASDFLEEVAHSRITFLRLAAFGVRGLIMSGYFDQTEVHEALDYHPVPFMRERMARRQQLLDEGGAEPVSDGMTEVFRTSDVGEV